MSREVPKRTEVQANANAVIARLQTVTTSNNPEEVYTLLRDCHRMIGRDLLKDWKPALADPYW